jgi:hypothetical protein
VFCIEYTRQISSRGASREDYFLLVPPRLPDFV